MTQTEHLTNSALAVGAAALRSHGPQAAITAMQPWAVLLEKAKRKQAAKEARHA